MEENILKVNLQNITGEICWNEKQGDCPFWKYDTSLGHHYCSCDTSCIRKNTDIKKIPIK
jgi:hypothetical protein